MNDVHQAFSSNHQRILTHAQRITTHWPKFFIFFALELRDGMCDWAFTWNRETWLEIIQSGDRYGSERHFSFSDHMLFSVLTSTFASQDCRKFHPPPPAFHPLKENRIRLYFPWSTILTLIPWDAWILITSWSPKSYPRISVVSGCCYVLPASRRAKPHPAIDMQGWGLDVNFNKMLLIAICSSCVFLMCLPPECV